MQTQHVTIPSSNGYLKGMILSNPDFSGKRPALLVIHGWTSAMNRYPSRVEAIVTMGYVAVLFDLRGHGETGGELDLLSPHDHLNDCLAAYDYMVSLEDVDTNDISVFGSSYGGYMASMLSAERKVDHMILNVPADYPDDIFDTPDMQRSEHTTEYRMHALQPNQAKALSAISSFTGDLLLIEAEFDEQVNPQVMQNYRNAAKEGYDYELIKGADHSMKNPGANEARIKVMNEWFEKITAKSNSNF
jgi:uncharacterized protein